MTLENPIRWFSIMTPWEVHLNVRLFWWTICCNTLLVALKIIFESRWSTFYRNSLIIFRTTFHTFYHNKLFRFRGNLAEVPEANTIQNGVNFKCMIMTERVLMFKRCNMFYLKYHQNIYNFWCCITVLTSSQSLCNRISAGYLEGVHINQYSGSEKEWSGSVCQRKMTTS